jgi:hypothetical protein
MGVYARNDLYDWFTQAYQTKHGKKLNIGKSCMRFTKEADIPYELLSDLATRITVPEWIAMYESGHQKKDVR